MVLQVSNCSINVLDVQLQVQVVLNIHDIALAYADLDVRMS